MRITTVTSRSCSGGPIGPPHGDADPEPSEGNRLGLPAKSIIPRLPSITLRATPDECVRGHTITHTAEPPQAEFSKLTTRGTTSPQTKPAMRKLPPIFRRSAAARRERSLSNTPPGTAKSHGNGRPHTKWHSRGSVRSLCRRHRLVLPGR